MKSPEINTVQCHDHPEKNTMRYSHWKFNEDIFSTIIRVVFYVYYTIMIYANSSRQICIIIMLHNYYHQVRCLHV